MQILFDDSKRIVGVYENDLSATPAGLYVITTPEIKTKLAKTNTSARQQHDSSGKPLFLNEGRTTTASITRYKPNQVLMEEVQHTRGVSLKEAPAEWTVEDVLREKYTLLAAGKKFWYDQFLSLGAITKDSIINRGVFGVSIPPKGELKFKPIKLAGKTTTVKIYIEADDASVFTVFVEPAGDATKEVKVVDGVAQFVSTDTLSIRMVNTEESGIATPLRAFAIFY